MPLKPPDGPTDATSPFIGSDIRYIQKSKRPVHVKDQSSFHGDGITSDQGAYVSAVAALPTRGGTLALPAGISLPGTALNALTVRGVKVVGEGWSANANAAFANAAWLVDANFGGTILRFTNTTGVSVNFSDSATLNGNGLRDLMIVGPGSGTSVGLQLGNAQPSAGLVKATLENVFVANFSVGWQIRFVEDCTFISPTARGCKTGFALTDATNQNVFLNTEVQFSDTDAITLSASGGNQFYGGLLQNISGTAGIRIIDNDINLFDGWWAEAVTAPWVVDITTGTRNAFSNWRMGSNVVDAVRTAGNATTLRNMHITRAAAIVSVTANQCVLEACAGVINNSGSGSTITQCSGTINDSGTNTIKIANGASGVVQAANALRTKHEAAATPTGGASGDIRVGNSKIWVNDAGTWKSAVIA